MRRRQKSGLALGSAALAAGAVAFGMAVSGALSDPLRTSTTAGDGPEAPASVHPVASTTELRPVAVSLQSAQPSDPQEAEPSGATPRESQLSAEVLDLAVDEAPFEESRRAPAGRYRLPGEERAPEPEPVELPPPPDFELLGAVAGPDGGFVVLRVDGEDPRMVDAGETIEGYTLAAVHPDRATLEGVGRRLEVPLAAASPTVRQDDDDDDRRRRRRFRDRDDDDDDDDSPDLQEQMMERSRQILEQLQSGGGGGQLQLGSDGTITLTRPGNAAGRLPRVLVPGSPGGSP